MDEGKGYTGGYVFNIEYNHVHNWGSGIVSDFGAIYIGSSYNCDGASLSELEQHCYTHAQVGNTVKPHAHLSHYCSTSKTS